MVLSSARVAMNPSLKSPSKCNFYSLSPANKKVKIGPATGTKRITKTQISFVVLSLNIDFKRLKRAMIGNKIISDKNMVQKRSPILGKSCSILFRFNFYLLCYTIYKITLSQLISLVILLFPFSSCFVDLQLNKLEKILNETKSLIY